MNQKLIKTSCNLPKPEWISDIAKEKYCAYCGQEKGKQVKEKCIYKV